jgi:hypothetical protein
VLEAAGSSKTESKSVEGRDANKESLLDAAQNTKSLLSTILTPQSLSAVHSKTETGVAEQCHNLLKSSIHNVRAD